MSIPATMPAYGGPAQHTSPRLNGDYTEYAVSTGERSVAMEATVRRTAVLGIERWGGARPR